MTKSTPIPRNQFLFLVGAMKSGTTSLFNYLNLHPNICASDVKEPEFFSEHQLHGINLEKNYFDLWHFNSQIHAYALEASTGYSKPEEPNVAARIKSFGICPKILYIVRNPFDRIESHHNFMRQSLRYNWQNQIDNDYLIDATRYFSRIQIFTETFGQDQVHVIPYEFFIRGDARVVEKLFSFLDLDHIPQLSIPSSNVTSKIPSKQFRRFRKVVPVGLREWVPSQLKTLFWGAARNLKVNDHVTLSDESRNKVFLALKDEMEKLKHYYDVPIQYWGF